jgi:multidrug efflux pump subunit AcrA (membrane-fusion protein)
VETACDSRRLRPAWLDGQILTVCFFLKGILTPSAGPRFAPPVPVFDASERDAGVSPALPGTVIATNTRNFRQLIQLIRDA